MLIIMENPFLQEEINAEVSLTSNDTNRQKISYSEIAEKLIRDKLWLTALELHAELIEAGKEVPRLRDFFSNPGNFENQSRPDLLPSIPRSASQATLDSLDFTRFSEDGERGNDERIAVLEFELRKAKETINALRATLTVATGEGTSSTKFVKGEPIKPHESRALNFLINEYLLTNGYKLTAITFADENEDQDFEDWDDVGLNMPKPSELLHLYRVGIRQTETSTSSVSVQTDPIIEIKIEEPPAVNETTTTVEEQKDVSPQELSEISLEHKEEKEAVSETSGSFEEIEAGVADHEAVISVGSSQDGSGNNSSVSRTVSTLSSEMWSELPHLPQLEGYESFTYEELVSALSLHLPSLLQHLPLNTKEWLQRIVPLLVCLISLQQDAELREGLIHSLLEIKKRPSQEDRNIILSGVMRVCETLSEAAIEKHVLPHCWELMSHKYPEKRALVAQACPHVSLYISRELRESLVISILKQLLDDKEEMVRSEAVASLAHIAATMSRNYHQVEELTLKAVVDKSDVVVKVSLRQLCPVTARWALNRGRLTQFLSALLAKIGGHIKEDKLTAEKDRNIVMCLRALSSCLPYFVSEQPQPRSDEISPLLVWIKDTLVPEVLDILEKVDPKREDVVVGFLKFFVSVTNVLGATFCVNQVKGKVESRLDRLESNLLQQNSFPNLSIIPVYILGILAPLQVEEEIEKAIGRLLVALGLCGAPPEALCLVAKRCAQDISLIEPLLSALWQGVVHSQRTVKEMTCKLLAEVVPHVTEQMISTRILPPLVTLASDSDLFVRVSTLIVHTLIIECCSSREVVEKCYLETERILCDSAASGSTPILLTIISAVGRMAPRVEPTFREQVILREFEKLSRKCSSESEEVVAAMVEAFSNTVYSQISKQAISNTLLPSLRNLEAACMVRLPTHSETVSAMIRELEARIPAPTPQSMPRSGSSLSLNPGNVEEMKQKVTKMFTTPISKQTNLHNIFWKK